METFAVATQHKHESCELPLNKANSLDTEAPFMDFD